uniref:DUF834 domain-containing protein n=1 Tax=Oryza rufipogon TaxID=4529 RepID=A0A0E0QFR2_ORYRU
MEGSSLRRRLDGVGSAAGHDGGAAVPGESEGFGLRLLEWRLRVVWRVSWREGGARGGCGGCRDAFGVSRAQAVSAGNTTGKASAASALQDLQREVKGVGRGRQGGRSRLVASGVGFGRGRRLRVSEARGEAGFAGGRLGGRGIGFADGRRSEIRGQRKNGRLGGDDLRLASYVFDGMPARKERGRNRRERWGAGPLVGGVQGAWAH